LQPQQVHPEDFGLSRASLDDLSGGDAQINAEIIRGILQGEAGARRDLVLLNAAPAIVCAGKAPTLAEGARGAARAIESGQAGRLLEALRRFTNQKL
jgi:anthranilate phosphoribosyltransferase